MIEKYNSILLEIHESCNLHSRICVVLVHVYLLLDSASISSNFVEHEVLRVGIVVWQTGCSKYSTSLGKP